MGAKILRLFGRMSEEGIEPTIDWGNRSVDQTSADAVIYTAFRTSLFARFEDDASSVEMIHVHATVRGRKKEWTVPVVPIQESHSPIPLLWAREKIRELEDAEARPVQNGSRQEDRKRSNAVSETVSLSKVFGILSRHTSFVAVEEREEKDRTTGEAVLCKIPVPVTMGWHGFSERRWPPTPYTTSEWTVRRSIVTESTLDSYMASAPSASCKGVFQKRVRAVFDADSCLSGSGTHLFQDLDPDFHLVMAILERQKAKGGFSENETLAAKLGFDLQEILSAAQEIAPFSEKESPILLWSAVLLQVLEQRFSRQRKSWEKAVKKTRKWFEKTAKKENPHLQGENLSSWAARFVSIHCTAGTCP